MSTMTFGGAPKCQKCQKAVYFTEQVPGPGGLYHRPCLACTECTKRLDSTTLTENSGNPYCKGCYGKLFGPKGFGYGVLNQTETVSPTVDSIASVATDSVTPVTASTPSPTTSQRTFSAPAPSTSNGCPCCSKPVYFAEQVHALDLIRRSSVQEV